MAASTACFPPGLASNFAVHPDFRRVGYLHRHGGSRGQI